MDFVPVTPRLRPRPAGRANNTDNARVNSRSNYWTNLQPDYNKVANTNFNPIVHVPVVNPIVAVVTEVVAASSPPSVPLPSVSSPVSSPPQSPSPSQSSPTRSPPSSPPQSPLQSPPQSPSQASSSPTQEWVSSARNRRAQSQQHQQRRRRKGCGALIFDREHAHVILVLQRAANNWSVPKGHMEDDDTDVVTCTYREVKEETGLDLDELTHADNYIKKIDGYTYTAVYLDKSKDDLELAPEDVREIVAARWIPIPELGKYMVNANRATVDLIRRAPKLAQWYP